MNRAQKYFLVLVLALSTGVLACRLELPKRDLVFTPDTLPEAQVGVPYKVIISISENETPVGDFQILEGSLPNGLTLESLSNNKAKIYGIPEEVETFTFKVYVWCQSTNTYRGQTAEKEYTIEVK